MTDCGAEPLLRGLRGGPGMRGRGRAAPQAAALGWRLAVLPPSLTEWRFGVVFWGFVWVVVFFFFSVFVCLLVGWFLSVRQNQLCSPAHPALANTSAAEAAPTPATPPLPPAKLPLFSLSPCLGGGVSVKSGARPCASRARCAF